MEDWSNNACLGYVIAGLDNIGKTKEEIQLIVNSVRREFDWVSVEEASDIYNNSPY